MYVLKLFSQLHRSAFFSKILLEYFFSVIFKFSSLRFFFLLQTHHHLSLDYKIYISCLPSPPPSPSPITLAHPIIASSAINSSSSSSATGVDILPVGATGKIPSKPSSL